MAIALKCTCAGTQRPTPREERGGGGGAGECLLNIRAGVKFTKSCLFRSKIETDTLKELAKTYQEWAALAQKVATGQVAAF